MTTLAQRISETPMAPYAALLRGMTREQVTAAYIFSYKKIGKWLVTISRFFLVQNRREKLSLC